MLSIRLLIALLLAVGLAFSANSAIGVAIAHGAFQVDKSKVYGNTTLFDGSYIETSGASSDLVLNGGARVRLATDSQARVHATRLVLEKGQGQVTGSSGYSIEALSLRVTPDSPNAQTTVTRKGASGIEVAAVTGSARISGPNGILIASVTPGTAVAFDPQAAGAAAPTRLTGRLGEHDAAFLLPDTTSKLTFELAGPTVHKFVGKCVEVTGTIDSAAKAAAGAVHLVRVLTIKEVSCDPVGGWWWSHKKIWIAGVAIGATAATAGVIENRSSDKEKVSRK